MTWWKGQQYERLVLLPPRLEGVRKRAIAERALRQRQDGAAVVGVHHRNVEPGALLEQLRVALAVRLGRRKPDQEEAVGDFHGEAGKRHAARRLGLLH